MITFDKNAICLPEIKDPVPPLLEPPLLEPPKFPTIEASISLEEMKSNIAYIVKKYSDNPSQSNSLSESDRYLLKIKAYDSQLDVYKSKIELLILEQSFGEK